MGFCFSCIYTLSKMRNNDVLESSMSDLVGNIAPSVIPANNIAPQPLSEMAYQMGAQAEGITNWLRSGNDAKYELEVYLKSLDDVKGILSRIRESEFHMDRLESLSPLMEIIIDSEFQEKVQSIINVV